MPIVVSCLLLVVDCCCCRCCFCRCCPCMNSYDIAADSAGAGYGVGCYGGRSGRSVAIVGKQWLCCRQIRFQLRILQSTW